MTATAYHPDSTHLPDAYRTFDLGLRVVRARTAYILAMVLMPAGITLDYFVYPGLLRQITIARLLCDVALLPFLLALLLLPAARRWAALFDKPVMLLPAISMCWMIYRSEGAISPYYAGLNLIVVAICILIPLTAKEATLVCAAILLIYATACLLHGLCPPAGIGAARTAAAAAAASGGAAHLLYNNIYFLVLTSVISVAACHHNATRRFEDFRLRHELAVNNRELAATLNKLQETEVQLVQSEKMNALGKLAAGLLHEVNNPLNFTFMALQVAQEDAAEHPALKDTLADIHQGMTRIKGVISDLRTFAYPTGNSGTEAFPLGGALTTALRLTAHELNGIAIDHAGVNGQQVLGCQTQLAHVFMNLLVNSAHAVRGAAGRSPQITVSCAPRGDGRLDVHVRDNGTGVKAAHLPRLLEPFFTTKEVGEGTGLGLSICHTIIKNHGGDIRITSEEGQWTQVSFDLPLRPETT